MNQNGQNGSRMFWSSEPIACRRKTLNNIDQVKHSKDKTVSKILINAA